MLTSNGHAAPAHEAVVRAAAPPLRLAVALGDPDRDRRLLPALAATDGLLVAERCLAAEQLVACARSGRAEALLVALDLHRLTADALAELASTRLPLVLLGAAAPPGVGAPVLPLDADPALVCEALLAAVHGERPAASPLPDRPPAPSAAPPAPEPPTALGLLAVASGHGAPGRTTVAVNLAAALGLLEPTVLVDLDVGGPSVAAYLDLDPTRNLYMLAHAEPDSPAEWQRAVAAEAQPLHPRCPHAHVLCGVPKPEMRAALTRGFLERLFAELRVRYRYVVVDVGADLIGTDALAHRAAAELADAVLLVAAADVVGLWHARSALARLRGQLGLPDDRLALVLNRHDARHHHGRDEAEWALGLLAAAVVPFDHRGTARAVAERRPAVLDAGSRAGFYLLELAGRVRGGRIDPPPEPPAPRRGRRLPWPWRRDASDTRRQGHARHAAGA